MKKYLTHATIFVTGSIAGIIIIMLFAFKNSDTAGAIAKKEETKPAASVTKDGWRVPPLPSSIDFAGEKVPLERPEIREQLDREVLLNYYSPGSLLYTMKLSGRYFPLIEERLRAHGVPDDFKYLCVAESHLSNAISRVGATGFWQFMKGTAPMYDLETSNTIDERYHVLKSTDAACNFLKDAYRKFGSWTAAAASYNCGMGGYNDHAAFQQTKNYYDLLLPEETQRYIFRILAFKYLMGNSSTLGFDLDGTQRYAPLKTRTVTISGSIPNLASFAKEQGTNYKTLRWYNPWLRGRSFTGKAGKSYTVVLPAGETGY